jgi:hypothetical protein
LFCDAINANALLYDVFLSALQGVTLNIGDFLEIVRQYVLAIQLSNNPTEAAISEAISRELTGHSMLYGLSESSRGGADDLIGSDGNDMLFGQGGSGSF